MFCETMKKLCNCRNEFDNENGPGLINESFRYLHLSVVDFWAGEGRKVGDINMKMR